ncbi:glycosyl hydrolase family 5 [Pseudooceanicola sp. CBS1P-1]|uniref:cellulase n=1 Tax=Pseudooceanicola albus TaxID=2692189 RepID=A0A6L7G1P8_9RHOB|nr:MULTISPECIES: glycosyl hydrolase family 8 [Pseudooceanicola]MBT9385021.1 glycosyl hydrolase family 5 [Pseudooceanicola endophyticus]MXN17985.1 glycosyl hydrolase family 5 [Pseudooceanicola albus]
MNRRTLLRGLAAGTTGLILGSGLELRPALAQDAADPGLPDAQAPQTVADLLVAPWAAWKAAYLARDGRVVDALQQGASHSESQGYGLLLAAMMEDNPTFDLIYRWTEANLAVRADALLAWRWLPSGATRVPDRNNASDGDLFYAWALAIRGQRDQNPALIERAGAIANALVAKCVVPSPDGSGRLLLTPAADGFARDDGMIINPSYYMPRAMRELAQITGVQALATCATDGEMLVAGLAAGGLVPDWILVTASGNRAAPGKSFNNGYEAMRVALFQIWSGNGASLAVSQQAQAYRNAQQAGQAGQDSYVTVFDRSTGRVLETSPNVGYGAIAALVNCAADIAHGAEIPFYLTVDQPYYPATLHLMTLISQVQSAATCQPI